MWRSDCDGARSRIRSARRHEALQLVELDHLAGRKPAQLSGGQQQRVALARAIVNRPALLLLDEPLGALDLKLRRQMQLELKSIQNEVGLTFLHVTHDQEEAMTMADTVAVMNEGRIEQLGAPEELYELPRTVVRRQLPRPVEPVQRHWWRPRPPDGIAVDVGGSRIVVDKSRAQRHTGDGDRRGAPREGPSPHRAAGRRTRVQRARDPAASSTCPSAGCHAVPRRHSRPGHGRRVRPEPGRRTGHRGRDARSG